MADKTPTDRRAFTKPTTVPLHGHSDDLKVQANYEDLKQLKEEGE